MKRSGVCPKCASQKIVRGARAGNSDGALLVWSFRHPDALVFKDRVTTGLVAYVCGACGFTEFYSDAPGTLPGAAAAAAAPMRSAPKTPKPPEPETRPKRLPKPPPGKLPKRPPTQT